VNAGKNAWIYAGLAVAAGVGLVTIASPKSALGDPDECRRLRCLSERRILLIGDAMAHGLSMSLEKLAHGAKTEFLTIAKPTGVRVADWPALLEQERIRQYLPKLVLVAIGPADLRTKQGTIDSASMAALTAMLKTLPSSVIWVNPPKMPVEDPKIREAIKSVGGADLYPSEVLAIPRGPDGLRPTTAGFAGWAGAIWRWIS
jgi:hypothetical protein